MFELESKDLREVGMQMPHIRSNCRRYFSSLEKAKEAAEKDYGKGIEWKMSGDLSVSSGDLRYVMYCIKAIKVEG